MRLLAFTFFVEILTMLSLGTVRADPPFAPRSAEYVQLRDVAVEIRRRYPSDRYWVVGLGRSPGPVVTMLNLMSPGAASSLPLTAFRFAPPGDPRGLTAQEQERLRQQFDRFMPSPDQLGGRQIVLIDYSSASGDSLGAARSYLEPYLRSRRPGSPALGTMLMRAQDGLPAPLAPGVDQALDFDPTGAYARGLLRERYDATSLYGAAPLSELPTPRHGEPPFEHEAMRLQMAAAMSQDPALPSAYRSGVRPQTRHPFSASRLSQALGSQNASAAEVLRLSWYQPESRQALTGLLEELLARPDGPLGISEDILRLIAQKTFVDETTLGRFVDWTLSPQCARQDFEMQELIAMALRHQRHHPSVTGDSRLRSRLDAALAQARERSSTAGFNRWFDCTGCTRGQRVRRALAIRSSQGAMSRRLVRERAVREPDLGIRVLLMSESERHAFVRRQSVETLSTLLGDPETTVRLETVQALWDFSVDGPTRRVLAGRLADGNAEVRLAVLESLRFSQDPEIHHAIAERLADSDPQVRAKTIEIVSHGQVQTIYPRLRGMLADPDAEVRFQAVRALRWAKDDEILLGLVDALADPDPRVRTMAREVLSGNQNAGLGLRLREIAADARSPIRGEAQTLLESVERFSRQPCATRALRGVSSSMRGE